MMVDNPKHVCQKKSVFYVKFQTFRAMASQYFSLPRFFVVPGRAKIFRAMIFRAVPCHESADPPVRAVPGRPCVDASAYVSRLIATLKMQGL